jgi:ubiquitin-protein ligase
MNPRGPHRRRLALAHLDADARHYELYGDDAKAKSHATQKVNDWMANPTEDFQLQLAWWRNCWEGFIPGVDGTDWEGGDFPVQIYFTPWYPEKPPMCKWKTAQMSLCTNIYSDMSPQQNCICLSLLRFI